MALRLSARSRTLASFNAPGFGLFCVHSTFAAVETVGMAVHAWLVLELSNDSEVWIGIFALLVGTGQLFSSMLSGSIVDRFQRKNVLLIEGTIGAIIACGLAIATALEVATLQLVIGIAPVIGVLRGIHFTAGNRFVYDLVGPRLLVNGISMWRISAAPMMIIGALLAGALIEWIGIDAAYGFVGASLLLGLPLLAMISAGGEVHQSDSNLMRQTVEGLRYAATDKSMRTLFLMSIVMEMLGFSFIVMVPVMAKTVLNVGGLGLGSLQAGMGLGMLVAALVMAAWGDSPNKPRVIIVNALAAGVTLIGFAISRSLILSIFLAMAMMAFMMAYDLTLGALMQLVAPPHLRGRAVSLHSLAVSFTSLGGFTMGVIGSILGVPLVLAIGGAGIILNALARRPALLTIKECANVPPIKSPSHLHDSRNQD